LAVKIRRTALALTTCDWWRLLKSPENERSRKSRLRTLNVAPAGQRHGEAHDMATRGIWPHPAKPASPPNPWRIFRQVRLRPFDLRSMLRFEFLNIG
jgi:hypothetical protein